MAFFSRRSDLAVAAQKHGFDVYDDGRA